MIEANEPRSIESLNELSTRQLAETSALLASSRIDAVHYLQTLVRQSQLDHAADFLEEVVKGGADALTWRIRDVICVVDVSLPWLTEMTVERVENRLARVDGERWFRIVPRRALWDDSPFCGAPGVLVEKAPYWWWGPDSTNFTDATRADVEPVRDVPSAVGRWIASRVAWELRGEVPGSVDSIISRLRASPPSADAHAAIKGLLRESGQHGDGVPGFRGPDADYVIASE